VSTGAIAALQPTAGKLLRVVGVMFGVSGAIGNPIGVGGHVDSEPYRSLIGCLHNRGSA